MQYIEDKDDQLQILEDLFDLADDYGPGDSYPYNTNMLYYE